MVGIPTSLHFTIVTSIALLTQSAASRVQASEVNLQGAASHAPVQESSEQVSCAFATTFQVKNLIGRRTSTGNSLVAAVQTNINQMAVLCEQKESDLRTIAQLDKDLPDLVDKALNTKLELEETFKDLKFFEANWNDVTDSACKDARDLAGNAAQIKNLIGMLFKHGEDDPEQSKAKEKAKKMNERCEEKDSINAAVERMIAEIPNLQEQKKKKEAELVSLKKGLPGRSKAIKAIKAKTFEEIKAVFSGDARTRGEGRKSSGQKRGSRVRSRRGSRGKKRRGSKA